MPQVQRESDLHMAQDTVNATNGVDVIPTSLSALSMLYGSFENVPPEVIEALRQRVNDGRWAQVALERAAWVFDEETKKHLQDTVDAMNALMA